MVAFWTTRISAVDNAYYTVVFLTSGRVAPIALLPPVVERVTWALPFRWILAFPTELALGRLNAQEIVTGFLMQGFWIGLCLAALKIAWRAGVRRYEAVGG